MEQADLNHRSSERCTLPDYVQSGIVICEELGELPNVHSSQPLRSFHLRCRDIICSPSAYDFQPCPWLPVTYFA